MPLNRTLPATLALSLLLALPVLAKDPAPLPTVAPAAAQPGLNNFDFMSILLNQSLLRALRVAEFNSCSLKCLAAQ